MKIKILARKDKPFKNAQGEMMDYYWYDAVRGEDNVVFQFGSSRQYDPGYEGTLDIVKVENRLGRIMYKEQV